MKIYQTYSFDSSGITNLKVVLHYSKDSNFKQGFMDTQYPPQLCFKLYLL